MVDKKPKYEHNDEVSLEQLLKMKRMAIEANNLKELEKINRMIQFRLNKGREIKRGRKPRIMYLL